MGKLKEVLLKRIDGKTGLQVTLGILIWLCCLIFLCTRVDLYLAGEYTLMDKTIGIVFLLFTIMPFFYEIDVFGFKVRRELNQIDNKVNKTNLELNSKLLELKQNISLNNSNNLYFGDYNISDERLQTLMQEYASKNNNEVKNIEDKISVEESALLCFKVRYNLEKVLTKIAYQNDIEMNKTGLGQTLYNLYKREVIQGNLYSVLKEMIALCNRGIHGESLSKKQRDFIEGTYEGITRELEYLHDNYNKFELHK